MTVPMLAPSGPTGDVDEHHDEPEVPEPPIALGEAGRRLWDAVAGYFEFRPDEARRLLDAAATADLVERLDTELAASPLTVEGSMGQTRAHPLLAEVIAARKLLDSLLARLGMTDEEDDARLNRSEIARRAARARWDRR